MWTRVVFLNTELSCVPLSLANTDGTKTSNLKSALLGILSTGAGVKIVTAVSSPYVSCMVGSCVLIDGHALIQNLGKPTGCRTFFQIMQTYFKSNIFLFQSRSCRGKCSI